MKILLTILYRTYQLLIAAPIIIVLSFLTGVTTVIGSLLGNHRIWSYYPGKIWSILVCAVLFIPVTVDGREKINPNTSCVYVINHQGVMDIFLVYGYIGAKFKWMMRKTLRKMFFIGYCCEKAKFIFVDKSSMRGIKATIDQARDTLKHGMSVVIFPEGTRSANGKMRAFNKGAFMLADELQLPVVPITIDGSFEVLPRTRGFISFVSHHRMRLVIHDPIPPQGKGQDNMKALSKLSFEAINSALPPKHQTPIE